MPFSFFEDFRWKKVFFKGVSILIRAAVEDLGKKKPSSKEF